MAVAARVGERGATKTAQPADASPLAVRGPPQRGGGRPGETESKSRPFVMRPPATHIGLRRKPGVACRVPMKRRSRRSPRVYARNTQRMCRNHLTVV